MAYSQILSLLANHRSRAHHPNQTILSLTFIDRTTLSRTPYVLSEISSSCLSESSNIGLGHIRHILEMGKEEHASRLVVNDLVLGHYTFINTYWCWKATSWGSLIKQNIDGTALALNTYFFSLRRGYPWVVWSERNTSYVCPLIHVLYKLEF